jgi:TetR/AcrR family transcriptional repressor of multidrug resistance operon
MDRPAAIRRALRELVAERGFHGASMAAVAKRAGVATGTAYVHYESKDHLVYATYLEIKKDLADDLVGAIDPTAAPRDRYETAWRAVHRHFRNRPECAKFLTQIEESPYFAPAFQLLQETGGDPLLAEAMRPDVAELLVQLPLELIYSLTFAIPIRMAAAGIEIDDSSIATLIEASWRAIAR